MTKLDHRRKYYMILDCETATLPVVKKYPESIRKKIAIARPLIYDIGWQVIDRNGVVYSRKSFTISEIFSVPDVFNTAYYKEKRPIYLSRIAHGETHLTDWNYVMRVFLKDFEQVDAVGAYNSMFDFKKAFPFTESYISHLYNIDFYEWLEFQEWKINKIANGEVKDSEKTFDPDTFTFRGVTKPLFDVWGLACRHILNNDDYKNACLRNEWRTASGKYFKTSAETAFRFVTGQEDFEESHTAIDDAEIESQIFAMVTKKMKHNFEKGIIYFPFRELGTVEEFENSREES